MRRSALIATGLLTLALPMFSTPTARAQSGTAEVKRIGKVIEALAAAQQQILPKMAAVERCSGKGERKCLPQAARALASAAASAQAPVRRAVAAQRSACPRDAGNGYLRSLRTLRLAAVDLEHSRFDPAARRLRSSVKQAKAANAKIQACFRDAID